jgi:broad specificity phosphatase PhoE
MTIILVRHAERRAAGDDPALTPAGRKRAVLLARMLREAGITAIFTSSARRTKETAAPVAKALRLRPVRIKDKPAAARRQLQAARRCVLVVGHTDTVPELIAALGGPRDVVIDEDDFGRFFVLTVSHGEAALLLALRYGDG